MVEGFILRKIGEDNVVVPIGENIADFNGLIRINESAAILWKMLQNDTTKGELIEALVKEYDIDTDLASKDARVIHSEYVLKAVRDGCADVESCRLTPRENIELLAKGWS